MSFPIGFSPRRALAGTWPVLQATAAAAVAWVIARHVAQHSEPFFAPISAVIALGALPGQRGATALRVLLGVTVGIALGEVFVLTLGGGVAPLALAVFLAMLVALSLDSTPVVVVQSAASAILVVAFANGGAGYDRFIDALIGGGVALVFAQLLFPPEPMRLLRGSESIAVRGMARGLALAAQAVREDDSELYSRSVTELRRVRDRLSDLANMRRASDTVSRRTLPGRRLRGPVARENENAGQLDLLAGSCLLLARAADETHPGGRAALQAALDGLAGALELLAGKLGNAEAHQQAADCALDAVRAVSGEALPEDPLAALPLVTVRVVANDLLRFTGVPAAEARQAVEQAAAEVSVPDPPRAGTPLIARTQLPDWAARVPRRRR